MKHSTREAWLAQAVTELRPLFKDLHQLPKTIHAIVSWPRGSAKAVGQHMSAKHTAGKGCYVMITPAEGDPVEVLDTLVHELCHAALSAADDVERGHSAEFKVLAKAVGLEGPIRSTHAGDELKKKLKALSAKLGPYPHTTIQLKTDTPKKGGGSKNSVRLVSPVNPKYSVWLTPVQLAEVGPPLCPACKKPMVEAGKAETEPEEA